MTHHHILGYKVTTRPIENDHVLGYGHPDLGSMLAPSIGLDYESKSSGTEQATSLYAGAKGHDKQAGEETVRAGWAVQAGASDQIYLVVHGEKRPNRCVSVVCERARGVLARMYNFYPVSR